ncbi:MAG: hypothetical protein ACO24P_00245 [Candidatus Nanopelagicaceae bacterium]
MIELVAAIAGGLIGLGGIAAGSLIKRSGDGRDAIVKLSMGIEHIGTELQALRQDMKEDRHEIYGRLNSVEQRITAIEAKQ